MRFLIYGDDTYRSQKKLAALKAKFRAERDPSGLNERHLRYGTDDLDAVAEAIFAAPFLAERKLVVLDGYLGAGKDVQEKLVELLARQPDSTIGIFFHCGGPSSVKTRILFDALVKEKFSEEFRPLEGAQMTGFIAAECAEAGLKIEVAACRELTAAVGADAWALHHEIAKLCAYAKAAGADMIAPDMVRELTAGGAEDSVFSFLDACTQGRTRDAVNLLERILASGISELQMVAMLQRHVKSLLGARDLTGRGVTDRSEVARQLDIHPFPAGKAMAASRSMDIDQLACLLDELVEIERRAKNGTGRTQAEIGLFAVKMKSFSR